MTLDLIDYLEILRKDLNKSGVERTVGLKVGMGNNCPYYKKSKDIFLSNDYDRIKKSLLLVLKQLEIVEGKTIEEIIKEEPAI